MLVKIREQSTLIDSLKNENAEVREALQERDSTIEGLVKRIRELEEGVKRAP